MQEAKFSLNVRFNYKGYDSQFTMRDDTDGKMLINQFAAAVKLLESVGATPDRRWEGVKNGNGNGHAAPAPAATPASAAPKTEPKAEKKAEPKPVCKHCNSSEHMELVEFTKDGAKRKAWKCQECDKWHYEKNGKK